MPRSRLAVIAWRGPRCVAVPEANVGAAFHYVRSGRTVVPQSLPGPDELAALAAGRGVGALASPGDHH